MANKTLACPLPFLDPSKFDSGGFVDGRFCALLGPGASCCLPCPATDFLYPKTFKSYYRAAEVLNLVGLGLLCFLLISFIVLPAEKSRRHYLSYCLIIAALFLALSFVIPFGLKPNQCYDEITPNDMYSDLGCAFSGAFLIAGGISMAVWIFIRALSMHLQICWDVMPGKRFFYASQGLGWAVVAGFFTATITVTGVSYRFGNLCHVNSAQSTKDFWGPLLTIAGSATVVQIATFVYCIKVYLKNIWSDNKTETQSSAGLPSYTNSVRTRSARAVYQRVRKVLWLQWRGIAIVVFILVDVIFFSIVFIYLNSVTMHATDDLDKAMPFLICLIKNPIEHEMCTPFAEALFVSQSTVIAILVMISLAGIQAFILLVRTSMFTAWFDLIRYKLDHRREFVSLDAKHDQPAEIQPFDQPVELSKFAENPTSPITSPGTAFDPYRRSLTGTPDFLNKEIKNERDYIKPSLSFSAPLSSPTRRAEWDLSPTYSRGGLGFHPPISEDNNEKNKERL